MLYYILYSAFIYFADIQRASGFDNQKKGLFKEEKMKMNWKGIFAWCMVLCIIAGLSAGALAEELVPEDVLSDDVALEEVTFDMLPEEEPVFPTDLEELPDTIVFPEELIDLVEIDDNMLSEQSALELPDYSSEASARGFVYRMYRVALNREPDAAGLNHWVMQLQLGNVRAGDIVDQFFSSVEYQNRNRSIDDTVRDLYTAMMNRAPDATGLNYWKERLTVGMTTQFLASNFVNSNEFRTICSAYKIQPGTITLKNARDLSYERTKFVYNLYMSCLGRSPDTAGQENWCKFLARGGDGTTIANGFVFSSELWLKHLDNEKFVDVLYNSILGRPADAAGKAQWANQLNYSSSRAHVLNGFLFSQEFLQNCAAAHINVGKRIEEPDNTIEWKNNIEVLRLVNQQRTIQGLARLITREDLWRDIAMVRADELPANYSHVRPDGTSWATTYNESQYSYANIAENIARGYGTAAAVVNAWMNSPGHRANIMNSHLTTVATGYVYDAGSPYRVYWSQNFLTPW